MQNLNDVFGLWPSLDDLADDLSINHWTVKKWKTRRRIPADVWPDLLAAAKKRGKKLTADHLVSVHSRAAA